MRGRKVVIPAKAGIALGLWLLRDSQVGYEAIRCLYACNRVQKQKKPEARAIPAFAGMTSKKAAL
jgi:hypothetical protein